MIRIMRRECGLAAVIISLLGVVLICPIALQAGEDKIESDAKAVKLIVDYGDGVEKHFTSLPWKEGLTAYGALEQASHSTHGISFEAKDYGDSIGRLVTRIDDLASEKGGTAGRNWIYEVNGQMAKRACDKQTVQAGDVVSWTFSAWKP